MLVRAENTTDLLNIIETAIFFPPLRPSNHPKTVFTSKFKGNVQDSLISSPGARFKRFYPKGVYLNLLGCRRIMSLPLPFGIEWVNS